MEGTWGNKFCNKETERSQNNDHQSDPDILRKHEKQSSDDRNDSWEKLCESKQKTIRKNIGISNDAAYDITGAVAVQIGERKYLNMTDRFCTDILYRTEGHTVVNDIHDPGSNTGNDDHHKNPAEIIPHHTEINFTFGNYLVNRITEKYRYI